MTAGETGIGSAGNTGNFANYNNAASWNARIGNVTTVGTNGVASFYGAFDMSGNIDEWNDLTGAAGGFRGLRGGEWSDTGAFALASSARSTAPASSSESIGNAFFLSSSLEITNDPSFESVNYGFRLASPVAVPEPSTWVMGLAGSACGGWQMWRRRRARTLT